MAEMRKGSPMMGEMPMGKLIAKMSVPLMISMLVQSMYNLVDGYFVAKLGMEAITAIGISFPIHMLVIALANGLGVGMNALISQNFGRGQMAGASRAAGNQLTMALIASVVFLAFGLFGSGAYFAFCTDDPLTAQYGTEYLTILSSCAGFHLLAIYGERLLQVTGRTVLSMVTQMTGAVVNIVLDPILIFGLFGAPAMGVRGAALATVLGLLVAAVLGQILHHVMDPHLRVHLRDLRLCRDAVQILKVAFPVALTTGMSSLMVFGINAILKPYILEIAVFTVYYKLQSFLFMPTQGMMQGLVPIVGYNYGAKNGDRLRQAIRLGVMICLGIMIAGTLVMELVPGPVFRLFSDANSPEMLTMGIKALRIISSTLILSGVALVLSNIFQGMGNGTPSMIFALLRQCAVLLPVLWLLLQAAGVGSIWLAFPIAEVVTAVVIVFVFRKEYRRRVAPLLTEAKKEME